MLLASLILLASIAEITAQILSLSYVYLISSDDGSIIRIFVVYVVLMGHVSTQTVKYFNENSFIENLAASKYSM